MNAWPGDRATLLRALAELPWEESFLLRCRYGIGCEQLSDSALARRLRVPQGAVAEIEEQALAALAFFLIAGLLDDRESGR